MGYLFTSESVSEGPPTKPIKFPDAVLSDKLLAWPQLESSLRNILVTTGQVVLAGEVQTKAYVDFQRVAREVIRKSVIPKANICSMVIHVLFRYSPEQSPDINRGGRTWRPDERGRRPGYDVRLCYQWNRKLHAAVFWFGTPHHGKNWNIRREGKVMTFRPDSKTVARLNMVTLNRPVRIDTISIYLWWTSEEVQLKGWRGNAGTDSRTWWNLIPRCHCRNPQPAGTGFVQRPD